MVYADGSNPSGLWPVGVRIPFPVRHRPPPAREGACRVGHGISATRSELVLPEVCLGLPATITIVSPASTMPDPLREFYTASTMASIE